MSSNSYDVIIIGAGAAGLMCAAALYNENPSFKVLIIDRNNKPGRKLLATGNGRCNFTNLNIKSSCYNTDDERKLSTILHVFDSSKIIDFFNKKIGVIADYKNDLVYPITYQSKTVTDALAASASSARFELNTEVTSVVRDDMDYVVNGCYRAYNIVFACGGVSLPDSGSNGSLYSVIKGLSGADSFEKLLPSLVPLKTSDKDLKKLTGIRQECIVSMDGLTEEGEILFTDYGVSGICIMQLSGHYNHALASGKKIPSLSVDLIPKMDKDKKLIVVEDLLRRFKDRGPVDALSGLIKKPLAEVVIGRSDGTSADIARILGDFKISLAGSLGFNNAQVTSGGLKLKNVTNGLEIINSPGAYVCGEALNVDGLCGGFNLHWAWASALTVASAISDDFEEV